MSKRLYRWIRDLHLYVGLTISPLVALYAISTLLMVHHWFPPEGDRLPVYADVPVVVDLTDEPVPMARSVLRQTGLTGEIGSVWFEQDPKRIRFQVLKPTETTTVVIDQATNLASAEHQQMGVRRATSFLHVMPGPHLVKIRRNWVWVRIWGWTADAAAYLLLFAAASGVYVWLYAKAERRAGIAFLAVGAAVFVVLVASLVL